MLIFINLMLAILSGYLYWLSGNPWLLFACGFCSSAAMGIALMGGR